MKIRKYLTGISVINILLFIGLICSTNVFGQKAIVDQDSLFRLKESQIKGYTNISRLVNEQGYKDRFMPVPDDKVSFFPGVSGPLEPTVIPPKMVTSWKKYEAGTSSRLVVLLTDTNSNWLGIVSGLKAHGIPFCVTTDIDRALQHTVILLYPQVDSKNISLTTLKKLRQHPSNGGVLIGFSVTAPSMFKVFGFGKSTYGSERQSIIIKDLNLPETQFIEDLKEVRMQIGNLDIPEGSSSTFGYEETLYPPLAVFEDGTAAITRTIYNKGACYAIGYDLGFMSCFAHANLDPQVQRTYINDFEPTLDVAYRLIKEIYVQYSDFAILPGLNPENKKVPILITHDIDYTGSVDTMLLYAEMEQRLGISATYFIQTKYVKDGLDQAFLNQKYLPYFIALKNMGMEIGSHSVSHTPFLSYIPLGTGLEKYPDYRPYYFTFTSTFNETLMGELRVSHFLIQELFGVRPTSFRSGYLRFPEKAHVAMQEVGFHYGSSIPANEVLSHLPFNPLYDYMFDSELDIFEIPVTIEDELPPLMDQRIEDAILLTEKIARYGGVVNVLIHTNVMQHKYRFQEAFIKHFKNDAWFGTVSQFGDWWKARTQIEVDYEVNDAGVTINLNAPLNIKGFTLLVPPGLTLLASVGANKKPTPVSNGLYFENLQGQHQIVMTF